MAYDDYTSILANYYRIGLKSNDEQVMTWAAKAIGQMSCIGSTITAECVAFDMQRALEWWVQHDAPEFALDFFQGLARRHVPRRLPQEPPRLHRWMDPCMNSLLKLRAIQYIRAAILN